jgi:hypothetical protein
MADEKETIIADDDEENIEEDKTEINEDKDKEEDKGDKPDKSEIAQKIKYREKWKDASTKVSNLEAELAKLKQMDKDIGGKPADDAEARAQKYIRDQAKAVYEDLLNARKADEEKVTRQFEEKVEEILDENPDITEKELLDAIEDFEVEPKVALKILRKSSVKKEKPKMPQAKRASADGESDKEKPNDASKSMWQVAREEIAKLKK